MTDNVYILYNYEKNLPSGKINICEHTTPLKTILGSCVSVILLCNYPEQTRCSMSHYLLPEFPNKMVIGDNRADIGEAKFGEFLLSLQISQMKRYCSNLSGYIIGGSHINDNSGLKNIGLKNIEIAHRFLSVNNIKVIGEQTGGNKSRHIEYYPQSKKVKVTTRPGDQSTYLYPESIDKYQII